MYVRGVSLFVCSLMFGAPLLGQTVKKAPPGPVQHPSASRPASTSNPSSRRGHLPLPAVPELPQSSHATSTAVESSFSTVVPVLSVDTTSPAEINVGRPAKYAITVRNTGAGRAEGVRVRPSWAARVNMIEATPKPSSIVGNALVFDLGNLNPDAKRTISVTFAPTQTGGLQLATKTSFSCSTSSDIAVRQPVLTVACRGPKSANFGSPADFIVRVTNTGDGVAEDVVIEPRLGGDTPAARQLKPLEIGWLPPGESQEIPLSVLVDQPERLDLNVRVAHAGSEPVTANAVVAVHRPQISVTANGPALAFVNRDGVYEIRVTNSGNAPAENINIESVLPRGMKLSVVGRPVQFDQESNSLLWTLESLAAGHEEILRYKASLSVEGKHTQQVRATALGGLDVSTEHLTQVMRRSHLNVAVRNTGGPAATRQPAEFTIAVSNDGTKAASGVRVKVELSGSLEPVVRDGYTAAENLLIFPMMEIPAGEQTDLSFSVIGYKEGEHVVKVTIESAGMSQRLTTETSAFFYDNEVGDVATKPAQDEPADLPPIFGSPL